MVSKFMVPPVHWHVAFATLVVLIQAIISPIQ